MGSWKTRCDAPLKAVGHPSAGMLSRYAVPAVFDELCRLFFFGSLGFFVILQSANKNDENQENFNGFDSDGVCCRSGQGIVVCT